MGSYAYDYLNDSLLLDSSLVARKYKGVSISVLENELQNYRDYCLKVLPEVREIVKQNKSSARCLATDTMSQISNLKQAALYLEEAVVSDPIFELTDFPSKASEDFQRFVGMNESPKVECDKLAEAATKLINLRPLVVGGYVKLYPVSLELERELNQVPLLYSDNGFENSLPKPILEQYKENAQVRSVENENGSFRVLKSLRLGNQICVQFQGSNIAFVYKHITPQHIKCNDESRRVMIALDNNDSIPNENEFRAWVKQSVNQSARNHFNDLNKRIALCDFLGSMFCTEHPFESALLNTNVGSRDIQSNTLNCTLQMDVPFLENVSSLDLMRIRNNDGEAFQAFRKELEKGLREVRHETDPIRVQAIVEDTKHELFEVRMSQIAPLVKQIRNTHLLEAGIALAGLGLSVVTGGSSLYASGLAIAHGCKSNFDYKSKVNANPCHFLWKVKQSEKKSS